MPTVGPHRVRDAPRACDVCGHLWYKSDLTRIGPLQWACPDDVDGLTALQISRHNANARPLIVRPVRHGMGMTSIPDYTVAEADIFNLVLKYAPQQVFLAEAGSIGDNLDSIVGLDKARTAGWMAFYLGNVVLENRRPLRWLNAAKTKLLSMCDLILAHQFMETTFLSDALAGGMQPTSIPYGGVYYGEPPLPYSSGTNTLPIDVHGTAICLLALLRAFLVSGLTVYRDGARRCATFLRRAQCVGLCASTWSQTDPSGTRMVPGPFPATVTWDFDDHSPAGTVTSYRFTPDGIICAWALSELQTVDGDGVYGDTQANINVNDFALATASTLSAAVKACVDWWTNGQLDGSTNTVIVGFSSTTPRSGYLARANPSGFTSQWLAESIFSFDYAAGIRSLWQIGGYTAKVGEVYSWLRGGPSNTANQVPASWTSQQIQKSLRGSYDPNLSLATIVTSTASDLTGTGYDWRTVGLLAPLQSAVDSSGLDNARSVLSARLQRAWRMRMDATGNPLNASGSISTVEAAQYFRDLESYDDPRLITQTGLSMQTSSGLRRPEWTSGLLNGHYIDLQGAAIIGDMYRWDPRPPNLMEPA